MKNKVTSGFTLIELMVVVVILGILSAVIVPRIPDMVTKARESSTKSNLVNLKGAINIYYADNDGLYPVGQNVYTPNVTYFEGCLVAKYLKRLPYCYVKSNHSKQYTVDNYSALDPSQDNTCEGEWAYVGRQTDPAWGTLFIECWHADSGGTKWSNY